jgi:hypothetical protein
MSERVIAWISIPDEAALAGIAGPGLSLKVDLLSNAWTPI